MASKSSLANVLWELPWILKLLIAIFFDCVYGVCRFVDGLLQKDILKAVIGFLWIFYGLFSGWIADIIFVALNRRTLLF